jgi:hypothetical protein
MNDIEKLYEFLGINPEKIPPKPDFKKLAGELFAMYQAFIDTGFTKDQAFQILMLVFERCL